MKRCLCVHIRRIYARFEIIPDNTVDSRNRNSSWVYIKSGHSWAYQKENRVSQELLKTKQFESIVESSLENFKTDMPLCITFLSQRIDIIAYNMDWVTIVVCVYVSHWLIKRCVSCSLPMSISTCHGILENALRPMGLHTETNMIVRLISTPVLSTSLF